MIGNRPQADRLLVAEIFGEARHRAKWRELTGDEEAAAVAELQALAGGRADLLAEVAGIFEGGATSAGGCSTSRRGDARRVPECR